MKLFYVLQTVVSGTLLHMCLFFCIVMQVPSPSYVAHLLNAVRLQILFLTRPRGCFEKHGLHKRKHRGNSSTLLTT